MNKLSCIFESFIMMVQLSARSSLKDSGKGVAV